MFYPDQKIVCINAEFKLFESYNKNLGVNIKLPVKDKIYTVRCLSNTQTSVFLQEIVNAKLLFENGYEEPSFLFYHFIPLEEYFKTQSEQLLNQIQKEFTEPQRLTLVEHI